MNSSPVGRKAGDKLEKRTVPSDKLAKIVPPKLYTGKEYPSPPSAYPNDPPSNSSIDWKNIGAPPGGNSSNSSAVSARADVARETSAIYTRGTDNRSAREKRNSRKNRSPATAIPNILRRSVSAERAKNLPKKADAPSTSPTVSEYPSRSANLVPEYPNTGENKSKTNRPNAMGRADAVPNTDNATAPKVMDNTNDSAIPMDARKESAVELSVSRCISHKIRNTHKPNRRRSTPARTTYPCKPTKLPAWNRNNIDTWPNRVERTARIPSIRTRNRAKKSIPVDTRKLDDLEPYPPLF